MKSRRSTQLVVIGVAVFVLGATLVFLATQRGGRSPEARAQTPGRVEAQSGTTVTPVKVSPTVSIPKGQVAVAVDLPGASGLGGWAKPGVSVDVYALVRNGPKVGGLEPPYSKAILNHVSVIDVRPGSSSGSTMLFALTPQDAERLTFYTRFESIWVALADPSNDVKKTTGRDYKSALAR